MSAPPHIFDRDLHRRRLDRAASGFARADFLRRRVAADAVDRLESILRDFEVAVDLGARDGAFEDALRDSPAAARVGLLIESDLSARMLEGRKGARVVLDEERLPFAPASVALVLSLLALHWTNDLPGALAQIRRALRPDGLFIGALFGGATLFELRTSLLEAEAEISGGAGPRVSPFADGLDAAGLLPRAGVAQPVAAVARVVVERARRPAAPRAEPPRARPRLPDLRRTLRRPRRPRARHLRDRHRHRLGPARQPAGPAEARLRQGATRGRDRRRGAPAERMMSREPSPASPSCLLGWVLQECRLPPSVL